MLSDLVIINGRFIAIIGETAMLKKMLIAAAICGTVSGTASAETVWRYGDSTFTVEPGTLNIIFKEVRIGLQQEGVLPGQVLFSSTKINGHNIVGMSRLFRKDCGTAEYAVSGVYDLQEGVIFLAGSMPIRNKQCQVERYQDAVMKFSKSEGTTVIIPENPLR